MTDEFLRNVELYKRGMYEHMYFTDKITKQGFSFHPKQIKTIQYLNDDEVSYVGYGGAARGGKSALIALDAIFCAYAYPECANLIGRKNLTTLWETTWKTLLRMLNNFEFVEGVDFRYNGQRHELTFENNSLIIAKNLELKPSDTEATEFGSLEILRAYVDQSEHVPMKIIEKVGERAGSHFTTTEYKLKGKVLEAFNPSGSHVKRRYWTPFKTKTEKETRKFVQALPQDNPGREAIEWVRQKEKDYVDGTMSNVEYQKQIKGNFDFDDSGDVLCVYDNIEALFTNNHVTDNGDKYITADVARLGSDKAVIMVWYGWKVVEIITFDKSKITELQDCISALRARRQIPKHNCIADEDGVGGGLIDGLGIKGFINNSSAINEGANKSQYRNLKTQCGYKFAEKVNKHSVFIDCDISNSVIQEITEEIDQLRIGKTSDDGKLKLKSKSDIKEDLGRSPDYLDALTFRMWFELINGGSNTLIYNYNQVGEIPKQAINVCVGASFGLNPEPRVLIDMFVDGEDLYLKELLIDNTKDSLSTLIKDVEKDKLIISNVFGISEITALRNNGYNSRGIKEVGGVDYGVKQLKEFNIFVDKDSLTLKRDFDNANWKLDNNGNALPTIDGIEPHSLKAVRYAITGKSLWKHLVAEKKPPPKPKSKVIKSDNYKGE